MSHLYNETQNFIQQLDRENQMIEKQFSSLISAQEQQFLNQYNITTKKHSPLERPITVQDLRSQSNSENQVYYLQQKLLAANQSIECLQQTIKQKQKRIQILENQLHNQPGKISANMRRKQRQLQKQSTELQSKLSQEKKAMVRLQKLNRELLNKLKENNHKQQRTGPFAQEHQDLVQLCTELNFKLAQAEKRLAERTNCYNRLLESSRLFEERTKQLCAANHTLSNALKELLNRSPYQFNYIFGC